MLQPLAATSRTTLAALVKDHQAYEKDLDPAMGDLLWPQAFYVQSESIYFESPSGEKQMLVLRRYNVGIKYKIIRNLIRFGSNLV